MLIDIATNAFMQSIQNPVLTTFSKFIAIAFDPITLIIISLIIAIFLYFKNSKNQAIFLASTILTTGIIVQLLKETFQRARPLNALISKSGFAFPSGSTTVALVFFGLMIYLFADKKYKLMTILLAGLTIFLIGFTRIYLRVHWVTDVIGGFIIGGIILAVSIIIYRMNISN